MSTGGSTRPAQGGTQPASADADARLLHSLGYAQELARRLGRYSNFAISFSIVCILSGGINSLAQAIAGAGGIAIGLGWPLGVAVAGIFGVAMAQIASSFPTAGGLYHWGSILGNRFTGWLAAWFNLLGLVTVLGSINVGTYYFMVGAFGTQLGLHDSFATMATCLGVATLVQGLVNHYGIGLTARLTDFSGWLIFVTALLLTITCLASATHPDYSRLWSFANQTGLPAANPVWPRLSPAWAFMLSLLLPVFTITGYDASAHTAEETHDAPTAVPRGILHAILWSGVFGWLFLVAFLLMLPDLRAAADQGWNVFFWAMDQRVAAVPRYALYAMILASQFLCGLATVTSTSRMIYAFARDGGLPASSALARVSHAHRTPAAAIWTGSVLAFLFVVVTKFLEAGGTPVYSIVVSCTVIFIFCSYAIPVVLGAFALGGPKWPRPGPFDLGRTGYRVVALLSVAAMLLVFVLGVQPPNDMALRVTLGFLLLAGVVWLLFERRRFQGPPIGDAIARRQAAIAAAEAALGD